MTDTRENLSLQKKMCYLNCSSRLAQVCWSPADSTKTELLRKNKEYLWKESRQTEWRGKNKKKRMIQWVMVIHSSQTLICGGLIVGNSLKRSYNHIPQISTHQQGRPNLSPFYKQISPVRICCSQAHLSCHADEGKELYRTCSGHLFSTWADNFVCCNHTEPDNNHPCAKAHFNAMVNNRLHAKIQSCGCMSIDLFLMRRYYFSQHFNTTSYNTCPECL